MGALVIKEWRAETKPIDSQNNFVRITGRKGGLIAWILSLMGKDAITTILVGRDRIEFYSASLSGTESRIIPLQNVCSTYYGYHKPLKVAALIIALFISLGILIGYFVAQGGSQGGAFTAFIITSVIGVVIAPIYYFLNRILTFGFLEVSGVIIGIKFKRSVIENVDINQEQAKQVYIIIQRLIEAKVKRQRQAVAQ